MSNHEDGVTTDEKLPEPARTIGHIPSDDKYRAVRYSVESDIGAIRVDEA